MLGPNAAPVCAPIPPCVTAPRRPALRLCRPIPRPRQATPPRNAAPRPDVSRRSAPCRCTLPSVCARQGRPEAVWSHRADAPHALSARCGRPYSAPSAAISPSKPMLQVLCVNLPRSPGPWPPPAAPSPAPHARAAPAVLCRPHKIRAAPLRARSCAVRRHASSSPPSLWALRSHCTLSGRGGCYSCGEPVSHPLVPPHGALQHSSRLCPVRPHAAPPAQPHAALHCRPTPRRNTATCAPVLRPCAVPHRAPA